MIIIVKHAFWFRKNIAASVADAFNQFNKQGHAEKLRTQITSKSLPSGCENLFEFLYSLITHFQWYVF